MRHSYGIVNPSSFTVDRVCHRIPFPQYPRFPQWGLWLTTEGCGTSVTSLHYDDVIMSTIASRTPSLTTVYLIVYSRTDQRKHQSSASLAFVRGIHRRPVNSPHKGPVTRKMVPFDDVIMVDGSNAFLLYIDMIRPENLICKQYHIIPGSLLNWNNTCLIFLNHLKHWNHTIC